MHSTEGSSLTKEARMKNLLTLASFYNHTKPDTALLLASEALIYAQQLLNQRGEGMALNMAAISYYNLSETDSAYSFYQKALTVFEGISDTMGMLHVYNNLGNLMTNTGDYSASLHYYNKVLGLAENLHKIELIALASNNLAIVYFDWSNFDLALEYYRKSLRLVQQTNDSMKEAAIFNNIGELYRETGQHDSALSYYQQALALASKTHNKKSMMNAYLNLGDIMKLRKLDTKAFDYYRQASELSNEIQSDYGKAYALIQSSALFTRQNDFETAAKLAHEGLQLSQQQKHAKLQKEAHHQLFTYYESKGQSAEALKHFLKYTSIKDTLFNQTSRKEIIRLRAEYETEKKEREIAQLNEEKALQQLEIDRQKNLQIITILIALTLLSAAAFFHSRSRIKQLAINNKLEKQKYEVEQKLLRAQINPHFIFNSLNSIQGYIIGNHIDKAQTFLGKFALLIRLILENSRKSLVSVEDEFNTLRLNLELEQMRFGNSFNFSLSVEDSIDIANTFIPPMLVQPFVENSIIHGIRSKEKDGFINIKLYKEPNALIAIVSDNGVGREASRSKRGHALKPHNSLGQKLTHERLELFGAKNGKNYGFEVIDLMDQTGLPSGTEVRIVMPFEEE